jgi:hypothetical protein
MKTQSAATRMLRVVPLLAILAFTGCSDTDDRQAASQPSAAPGAAAAAAAAPAAPAVGWAQSVDPCTLLSRAEVEQVVGRPVAEPAPNRGNAAICDFSLGDDGAIGITTQDVGVSHTPERMMAEFAQRNIEVRETAGLGDRSFFARHPYGITGLNTFKDQRCVILTVYVAGATQARQETVAEELMRYAVARL